MIVSFGCPGGAGHWFQQFDELFLSEVQLETHLLAITTHMMQSLAGEPESPDPPCLRTAAGLPRRGLPGPPRNSANHELQSHDVVPADGRQLAQGYTERWPPGY
jgi:hypothetical protein